MVSNVIATIVVTTKCRKQTGHRLFFGDHVAENLVTLDERQSRDH
jgi:hypothetical protein